MPDSNLIDRALMRSAPFSVTQADILSQESDAEKLQR